MFFRISGLKSLKMFRTHPSCSWIFFKCHRNRSHKLIFIAKSNSIPTSSPHVLQIRAVSVKLSQTTSLSIRIIVTNLLLIHLYSTWSLSTIMLLWRSFLLLLLLLSHSLTASLLSLLINKLRLSLSARNVRSSHCPSLLVSTHEFSSFRPALVAVDPTSNLTPILSPPASWRNGLYFLFLQSSHHQFLSQLRLALSYFQVINHDCLPFGKNPL